MRVSIKDCVQSIQRAVAFIRYSFKMSKKNTLIMTLRGTNTLTISHDMRNFSFICPFGPLLMS